MKKQTAVEWLMNQIMEGSMDTKTGDFYIKLPKHSFEQAKAIEREQIIDAYYQCGRDNFEHIKIINRSAVDYYNETYK